MFKNALSLGIKRAIEVSQFQVGKIKEDMVSDQHGELLQRACKTRMKFAHLDKWLEKVQSILPDLKAMMCQCALKELKPLVDEVKRYTPAWHEIVSDTTYVKTKAQQSIIGYRFTENLANAADTLFNALRDLAHTIITWSVSSQLEQDHAWHVLKGVALAAVNEAKLFLRVRAGCTIVQNMRGKDQIDQATRILSKGPMPATLTSALRQLAHAQACGRFKRLQSDNHHVSQPAQSIQDRSPPKRQKRRSADNLQTPAKQCQGRLRPMT